MTVGALVAKKISLGNAGGYVIAQCLSAIVAAFVIKLAMPVDTLAAVRPGHTGSRQRCHGHPSVSNRNSPDILLDVCCVRYCHRQARTKGRRTVHRPDGDLGYPDGRTDQRRGDESRSTSRASAHRWNDAELVALLGRPSPRLFIRCPDVPSHAGRTIALTKSLRSP